MDRKSSIQMLAELKLFAGFTPAEQRYIRRSLDVGLNRGDANAWARGPEELRQIELQSRRCRSLDLIRDCIPDDIDPEGTDCLTARQQGWSGGTAINAREPKAPRIRERL